MWAGFRAYFKIIMTRCQHADHILLSNHNTGHKIRSLVDGYILNCRCEAKSPATIGNYRYRLNCFLWFCQAYNLPGDLRDIKANHIRQFLLYLSTETNRWGRSPFLGFCLSLLWGASICPLSYYRVYLRPSRIKVSPDLRSFLTAQYTTSY